MAIKFSIIIPAYNAENNVLRCLNSLANQTFIFFEIVVVDDGSTDNTMEVINNFFSVHPEIHKTVVAQVNAGAGQARNKGISVSKGEYIVFLDSDDYVDKDYLEKVNVKIEKENSDVVFIDIIRETDDGKVIANEKMSDFLNFSKSKLIRSQLTGLVPWGGVRKVAKASIVKDNHLEYAPIKVGEESIYSFRLLEASKIISFQPEAIYHYVSNDMSLTAHDNYKNALIVFDHIVKSLEKLGKLREYISTVRALAITTTLISLNVLNISGNIDKYKIAHHIFKSLRTYTKGKVDYEAMDRRSIICVPFVKMEIAFPIFFVSKLQSIFRR